MRIRTATAAAVIAATAVITLTGCSSTEEPSDTSAKATPTATASELTDEQKASIREAAGLPPTPQPAEWAAYIKALNAIDTDIVHGKEEKAVSRGIDTCSSLKHYPGDTTKQVKVTRTRFTSPTHPEGRDTATATKILAAAHKHICPDF